MIKILRNNHKFIYGIILGIIISSVTTYVVSAASNFHSSDIEHKLLNNSTTTVKQALDDLYTLHSLGTADASHLLAGKTAISGGSFISGLMTDYSNSTAIACTTNNTSNKLYVKPSNTGYYTNNSSFDTGISYNPVKTYGSYTPTENANAITSGTTSLSNISLGKNSQITLPAGYYSSNTVIKNGVKAGDSQVVLLKSNVSCSSYAVDAKYANSQFFFVPTRISVSLSLGGDPSENTSASKSSNISISYSGGKVKISGCSVTATAYGNSDTPASASIVGNLYAVYSGD